MRKNQSGQITVFVIGMALLGFSVVAFAIDGTRAFLLRRTLQNAADAAAVAGASQLDEAAYYSSGGDRVTIDPGAGRSVAAAFVERRGLEVEASVEATSAAVTVVLRSQLDTPFLQLIGIDQVPVAAEAVAEPLLGGPGSRLGSP